jgi:hypothetical protein
VRNSTITAQQSLALFNDAFLLKQAELFAERLCKVSDKPGDQVEAGFLLAFGRKPSAAERELMVPFVEKQGLAPFCRVLFNANEFIFVE